MDNSEAIAHRQILIIEDAKALGMVLSRRIQQEIGCQVTLVGTYQEARAVLQQQPAPFLAIADLNLPDAPAGEVVDLLVFHAVPVFVFTSSVDDATRQMFIDKGVIDYFFKGSRGIDVVLLAVRQLLRNRQTTVLVVDDTAVVRGLLRQLLELYMYRVLVAPDGVEALRIMEENPGVRLVITDFQMPRMDGLELIQALREKHSPTELAIIGLSSLEDGKLPIRFIKAGANDFLHKPFEKEELYCRILLNLQTIDQIRSLCELNQFKSRFLGVAAHDLRTPIDTLRNLSFQVLGGACGPLTDSQRETLGTMFRTSDQMLGLVDDLLDVSGVEAGNLQIIPVPNSLSDLVRKRVGLHVATAERNGVRLEDAVEPIPDVPFDRERISQVIDNLIGNALKSSPSGSKIVVTVSQDSDMAHVAIAHQGPGLTRDDVGGAFAKAAPLPKDGEKTQGVGLAIVKKIILAHRGQIHVRSHPGRGVELVFSLPLSAA